MKQESNTLYGHGKRVVPLSTLSPHLASQLHEEHKSEAPTNFRSFIPPANKQMLQKIESDKRKTKDYEDRLWQAVQAGEREYLKS